MENGEEGSPQGDSLQDDGNSTSAGKAPPRPPLTGAEVIALGRNPIRETLLPIFLVVFCALIVGLIARWNLFNCTDYIMLILAYSLLFGAGGIVLGGALRVQGQFKPFGVPWTVDAAGGIAAAVIAGLLAYSMKPACSFDSKIQITGIPLHEPDSNGPVKTFVTVETDPNVIIQRGPNHGTLNFNFDDNETISIIMRAYRQEGQQYKFLAACEIQFAHKAETPEVSKDEAIYWLKEDSPLSLSFDLGYFKLVADADRNSTVDSVQNTCLKGTFESANSRLETTTAVTPLNIVREKIAQVGPRRGKLTAFFMQKKPAVPADNKAVVKEAAQTDTSPSNEVLTSPGTGSQLVLPPPTRLAKENISLAAAVSVAPPPGCLKDASIRTSVDAFLDGDDLDKKTRQEQIYPNWPDLNCYVLPIAEKLNANVTPLQQSRALKLLINAITNNSLIPQEQYYWQSDGPNRRDFKKQLPYLQESDLQRIFDLIPSDDALVRGEALRFVKLLPVDGLERLFKQKLQRLKTAGNDKPEPERTERFAVAGVSLYYNRIVEWLDGTPDSEIRSVVGVNFAAGMEWASDNYFNNRSAKPYEATLLYAKGIVEREQKISDEGNSQYKTTFAKMLARLRLTEDSYPLRSTHIAQALAFVTNLSDAALSDVLKQIQQADQLTPAMALDENSPFSGKTLLMYAGPKRDPSVALGTSISTKDGGNVLLRLGDWYFVRGKEKIGWIMRS